MNNTTTPRTPADDIAADYIAETWIHARRSNGADQVASLEDALDSAMQLLIELARHEPVVSEALRNRVATMRRQRNADATQPLELVR